jgi:EmrB/QacA subfamily drug resistance transporter
VSRTRPVVRRDQHDRVNTPRTAVQLGGEGDGDYAPDPRRWRALAVCMLAGFITLLDVSIVNVALPSIRTALDASDGDIQWVLSGYALTFGLVLVPAGRVGDARGRRMMFMLGVALFTAASALCGAAQSAVWLVLARLIQGIAGGLLTPQVSALIQQLFRGRERARAFGVFGSVIGISTAVGPVLGGLIINVFGAEHGWRWIFFVNLPIGIAAFVLAARLLPGPEHEHRPCLRDLDPVGVMLLGAAVVLLMLPLVEERQWHTAAKWLFVPASAALLALFVAWEYRYRKRHTPLVDLDLFRERSYACGSLVMLCYFAGFTSIFFVLTLYLQSGLGDSALVAGLAVTPFALGSAASAAVGGHLVARYGHALVAAGLLTVICGLGVVVLLVGTIDPAITEWAILGPLLVAGLGSGLVIAPNQALTLASVPPREAGSAGGVLQTGQRIGSALGIAVVGSTFFSRLASQAHPDWSGALRLGLVVSISFVVLALAIAIGDLTQERNRTAADPDTKP